MGNLLSFNFAQPSLETLIGICVEASDESAEKIPDDHSRIQQATFVETMLHPKDLFGLTLNVDDRTVPEHIDASVAASARRV